MWKFLSWLVLQLFYQQFYSIRLSAAHFLLWKWKPWISPTFNLSLHSLISPLLGCFHTGATEWLDMGSATNRNPVVFMHWYFSSAGLPQRRRGCSTVTYPTAHSCWSESFHPFIHIYICIEHIHSYTHVLTHILHIESEWHSRAIPVDPSGVDEWLDALSTHPCGGGGWCLQHSAVGFCSQSS